MKAYVYLIERLDVSEGYVGMTINPEARWAKHRKLARRSEWHVHRALRKHGFDAFRFVVLEELDGESEAYDAEMFYIGYLRWLGFLLYNMTCGGDGVLEPNDETRHKMRARALGRKHSEETKEKIARANKGFQNRLGQSPTLETRIKMSETMKRVRAERKDTWNSK